MNGLSRKIRMLAAGVEEDTWNEIARVAASFPELELFGRIPVQTALQLIPVSDTDILLLDLDAVGLAVGKILDHVYLLCGDKTQVVALASYAEHAFQGFESGIADYIRKPLSHERFGRTLERLKKRMRESAAYAETFGTLPIREKGAIVNMRLSEIVYLAANGKRTLVYTSDAVHETAVLLKDILSQIASDHFFRIHKRYAVNLRFLGSLRYDAGGRYILLLRGKRRIELPVGAVFAQTLRRKVRHQEESWVEE